MFIEYNGKVPRVAGSAFVAPTATLVGEVVVGEEASIWFGAVLRADQAPIHVGARAAVEDNAVLHASGRPLTVGADATIGHGAVLDDCTIEPGALVGSNAVVLAGATVGAQSVVAAGSVVVADERLGPRIVAAGAPARARKTLAGPTEESLLRNARETRAHARDYRRDNIGDPLSHEIRTTRRKRAGVS
ncbi:MAG: gamma carbonic anhydrase family protein [Vulcanimicrobiaceae bacterium]